MKFNNILVVLNPENDKQYALARAVRLAQEQKSHPAQFYAPEREVLDNHFDFGFISTG